MGAIVEVFTPLDMKTHVIDSWSRSRTEIFTKRPIHRENRIFPSKKSNQGIYSFSSYELKIKEKKGKVRLPPGIISGQNLYSLFSNLTIGYQDTIDFNHLPIPFACVAANSRSGEEVVLREGILPEAMRASMAIPGIFSPVEKDSMLLIDGGIINNYPVDIVREMGADIVIASLFHVTIKPLGKPGFGIRMIEQLGLFIAKEKRIEHSQYR